MNLYLFNPFVVSSKQKSLIIKRCMYEDEDVAEVDSMNKININ